MKAKILSEPIDKMLIDTLVLSIFKDEKPLKGANGLIDWRLCGRVSKLLMDKMISADYKESTLIFSVKDMMIKKMLIVGLGESKDFDDKRLYDISCFIADTLKKINIKKISLAIPGSPYFQQDYSKSAQIVITAFADSYEKKSSILEMLIFETGKRIAMVYEGAKQAKAVLNNNLLLTLDTK